MNHSNSVQNNPASCNAASPLQALSRLLDQALDLPPERLEPWLCSLGADDRTLLPRLRTLLAKHRAGSCAAFMSTGPRLDETADVNAGQAGQAGETGETVGPYRLLREVGRGGMSTVWLAEREDLGSNTLFAIKLPHRRVDESLARRAACEREITALMRHPHVARLRDAGVDHHQRPYLVLDPVAGQPLDVFCAARQLGVDGRLRLFVQLARAVAYVHGRGVVHRDLKPANVLVNQAAQVQLIDFGIACRLPSQADGNNSARDGEHSLTPSYASPEQLRSQAPRLASDVYSLGVVLFELLTGKLPFLRRRGLLAGLDRATTALPPPLASDAASDPSTAARLRGRLDAILAQALAAEPEQRHASARALADDIEKHLGRAADLARPAHRTPLRLVASNDSGARQPGHSAAWPGVKRQPPSASGRDHPRHAAAGRQKETRWNAT